MPVYQSKKPVAKAEIVPRTQLVKLKGDSAKLVPAIVRGVEDVIINTPEDYAQADGYLQEISRAEKRIEEKFKGTPKEPGPLANLEIATKQLKALLKEAITPLLEARVTITGKMKEYKLEEYRIIREENERIRLETERLTREAEAKQIKAATATPKMREKLEEQAVTLLEQADEVQEETPLSVQVVGSTDRPVSKARVIDLALALKGLSTDAIPLDDISTRDITKAIDALLNRLIKQSEDAVKEMAPYGVEVYEDVILSRRGV